MESVNRKNLNLRKLLTDSGIIRENWNVHQSRCNADPMYRLLFFGNMELEMSDGTTPRYVDYLLDSAIKMLTKRYGSAFKQSRWLSHVIPMLFRHADLVPKIFALLFILQKNPSLSETIFDLYDTESEFDMFSKGGNNQFYAFIKYIRNIITHHLNHAPNKYTIKRELSGFVEHAQHEYVMGPHPPPAPKKPNQKKKMFTYH